MVRLVDPNTGTELARLPTPEETRFKPQGFSPDGAHLILVGPETGAIHVIDLRAIREQLRPLGLDWDAPPYPSDANPDAWRTPLTVEVIGGDLLDTPGKLERYETERQDLALWINPFDADNRPAVGERLLQAGKLFDAIAHLTAAVTFRPDLIGGYRLRAQARFRLRDWQGAAVDATTVLAKVPADTELLNLRAVALVWLSRHGEAVADFTSLIDSYPADPWLYERRASCYEVLGEQSKADADWETYLRLPSDEPLVLNNQAWRLVTGPARIRDPKRAMGLISRAIEKEPGNATYLNTLGVVQYRNEQYTKAIETLKKSLAAGKAASDAFDLYFLSMCHASLGDRTNARGSFERAETWAAKRASSLNPLQAAELKLIRSEAAELLGEK